MSKGKKLDIVIEIRGMYVPEGLLTEFRIDDETLISTHDKCQAITALIERLVEELKAVY